MSQPRVPSSALGAHLLPPWPSGPGALLGHWCPQLAASPSQRHLIAHESQELLEQQQAARPLELAECQPWPTAPGQLVRCFSQQQQQQQAEPQLEQTCELLGINCHEFNFTEVSQQRVWLVKSWQEIALRVLIVAPIVLLGLAGNLSIIYSMCKFKRLRAKPTNVFILNMALADLLTTIVCPNAALLTDIFQFYVLGAFICRLEGFVKVTCLLVSAYSLIVLSFDWFLCVVQPCRTRMGLAKSWATLISIWALSVLMASPLFVLRRLRQRQWRDVLEVWCCEQIECTKLYWLGITFFLIYLPTCVMTIVLVVILLQMDRFEAKLRRSRALPPEAGSGGAAGLRSPAHSSRPSSVAVDLCSLAHASMTSTSASPQPQAAQQPASQANGSSHSTGAASERPSNQPSGSLSISIKYRRRIVKILFAYLLSSIVCWSPLQFTIIYRHFRSQPVPADWFFELNFYSQILASLSSALNPVIFGYLSQPFRRIVATSCLVRLINKLLASNGATEPAAPGKLELAARRQPARKQHIAMRRRDAGPLERRPNNVAAGQRRLTSALATNPNHSSKRLAPSQADSSGHRLTFDFMDVRASPAATPSASQQLAPNRWLPQSQLEARPDSSMAHCSRLASVSQRVEQRQQQATDALSNGCHRAQAKLEWPATARSKCNSTTLTTAQVHALNSPSSHQPQGTALGIRHASRDTSSNNHNSARINRSPLAQSNESLEASIGLDRPTGETNRAFTGSENELHQRK